MNNHIRVIVSDKMRLKIEQEAQKRQLSISAYIRLCLKNAFTSDLMNSNTKDEVLYHSDGKTLLEGNFHKCSLKKERVLFKVGNLKLVINGSI